MAEEPVSGAYGAETYGGGIYGKAALLVMDALADGTAPTVAHQLIDVMSRGTDDTLTVSQVVAAARKNAPEARPFLDVIVEGMANRENCYEFYKVVKIILAALALYVGYLTFASRDERPDQTTITTLFIQIETLIDQEPSLSEPQAPEPPAETQPTGHPPPEQSPDSP